MNSWDAQIVLQQFLQIHEQWVRIFDGASTQRCLPFNNVFLTKLYNRATSFKRILKDEFACCSNCNFVCNVTFLVVRQRIKRRQIFTFSIIFFFRKQYIRSIPCVAVACMQHLRYVKLGNGLNKRMVHASGATQQTCLRAHRKAGFTLTRIATSFALLVKSVDKFSY